MKLIKEFIDFSIKFYKIAFKYGFKIFKFCSFVVTISLLLVIPLALSYLSYFYLALYIIVFPLSIFIVNKYVQKL